MTDREKLIKMLETIYKEYSVSPSNDLIANYLLSNGVVVRGKGEWIDRSPYMGHYCSRCGRITGDAILYDGTLVSKFCDNCGADMRGKQHGRNV